VKLDEVIVPTALLGVYRPIDPGVHTIAVYPVGGSPAKSQVELHDGEKKEVKVVVPDGAPPSGVPVSAVDDPDQARRDAHRDQGGSGFFSPLRAVGIAASAVGVALVATGGVFLAKGFSAQKTANNAASMLCTQNGTVCPNTPAVQTQVTDNDSLAAKDKNIGVGVLVGGVVALGAGVALIVVGKPKAAPATAFVGAPPPDRAWSIAPYLAGPGGGLRGEF
jgi:hypothetical protein